MSPRRSRKRLETAEERLKAAEEHEWGAFEESSRGRAENAIRLLLNAINVYETVAKTAETEMKLADIYFEVAHEYENLGKYDEALSWHDRLIPKVRQHGHREQLIRKMISRACVLLKLAKKDEAIRALTEVLKLDPDNPALQKLLVDFQKINAGQET